MLGLELNGDHPQLRPSWNCFIHFYKRCVSKPYFVQAVFLQDQWWFTTKFRNTTTHLIMPTILFLPRDPLTTFMLHYTKLLTKHCHQQPGTGHHSHPPIIQVKYERFDWSVGTLDKTSFSYLHTQLSNTFSIINLLVWWSSWRIYWKYWKYRWQSKVSHGKILIEECLVRTRH